MLPQHWPGRQCVVRHGESGGDVAREAARLGGLHRIDFGAGRDVDVPLSPLGREQARAWPLVRAHARRRAA